MRGGHLSAPRQGQSLGLDQAFLRTGPMLRSDRAQALPLVPVSVCLAADLKESFEWGRHIAQAARESGKRVGFVASGSVSHKLVRGPEKGPRPADEELDHRLAKMLAAGEYRQAWEWLPEFAGAAGPSSGSGNYVISLLAREGRA